jgi:hypothetical protein
VTGAFREYFLLHPEVSGTDFAFAETQLTMKHFFSSVGHFYLDGFRQMKLGKTLWLIILIKLFLIFIVLKLFFFPDFLGSRFQSDVQKADFISNELINRTSKP